MAPRPFGPYQLVRQIAVGGVAEIHLAKTHGLAGFEKFCALKMIHPNFAQDEQFIEMLIDEAKIAVQLQHVNIAHTFDLGRVGETYYITMEFVDGADLYHILRKGSERDVVMPVDVAAFVAKEMANGLDYAHRKRDGTGAPMGIVHRDVSPQNVLVSTAGEVKLVDFGIAKATMNVRQTAVGVIKGKYYYMSPEQATGERLDHRSDIFSLGIVLYEMLVGQMLYLEEDIPRLLEMVRRANIAPVRTLRKDVPPQLERIVMHALAKRASDRYQSAGELAADLERFLHSYSPVFTSSKLAQHLRVATGTDEDADIEITEAPIEPVRRVRPDSAIEHNTLVTRRSELSDENSVIFRMKDLKPAPGHRRPPADPQAAKASPRMITASTLQIDEAGEGEVDHTMVTRAPTDEEPATAYDGPRGLRKSVRVPDELGEDFEPTLIEQAPTLMPSGQHLEDEQPTLTRDAFPSSPRTAETPTAPSKRGRAEPPPALAAHTPTPALSELRKPRESRRTPAQGAPIPSVLQAMIDGPRAPMPRPARGAGAPLSDGVPSRVADPALTNAPTGAAGGRGGGVPGRQLADLGPGGSLDPAFDMPTEPGLHPPSTRAPSVPPPRLPSHPAMPSPASPTPLPMGIASPPSPPVPTPPGYPPAAVPQMPPQQYPATGLPAHLMPYAYAPQPGQPHPGQPYPGQPYPGQPGEPYPTAQPYPYPYPYPGYAQQPQTLSRQLAALEIDEMPAQYRLGSSRSWLLRALLAIILVGAGVAAAVLIIRGGKTETVTASILIESKPSGAEIAIDHQRLAERTPSSFKTKPGARHDIDVSLPGYQPYHDTILVPESGGEQKILAFLIASTVRLKIITTPSGADVYVNGSLKGRSPIELPGLAPDSATDVEVRLKDYMPEHRTLTWTSGDEQTVELKLRR